MSVSLDSRFWSKVNKTAPNGCWEWQAGTNPAGYGRFNFNGRAELAHRLAIGLRSNDPQWALHHCDNPPCVNPAHLYKGTRQQNTDDAVERDRFARPVGERSGRSTDTPAQILRLRERFQQGESVEAIGRSINRNPSWVYRIVHGQRWADGPWPTGMTPSGPAGITPEVAAFVLRVRMAFLSGESTSAIGKQTGKNPGTIWRLAHGKRWPAGPWPCSPLDQDVAA